VQCAGETGIEEAELGDMSSSVADDAQPPRAGPNLLVQRPPFKIILHTIRATPQTLDRATTALTKLATTGF
jgi:hypothetical protein